MSPERNRAAPPRIARWLLERLIGDSSIAGELEELWSARVARAGVRAARAWYWRQVVGFLVRGVRVRAVSQQGGDDDALQARSGHAGDLPGMIGQAMRALRRQPAFTGLALLTLSLGIGASASMFAIVNGVLLQPLPYERADELVVVWPEAVTNVRAAEWLAVETRSFAGIAAVSTSDVSITGDGPGDRVRAALVTTNYFDVMGGRPILGRWFTTEESAPGRSRVVVLSYGLWQARYGGDRDVLGRIVRIDHMPFVVIGVAPSDHRPLDPAWQVWVPQTVEPGSTVDTDGTWWMQTRVARLSAGVALESAAQDLRAAAQRLAATYPDDIVATLASSATVQPLRSALVGDYQRMLWMLLSVVFLVLLIACTNVANLLLARGESGTGDVALRTALGASKRHLVTQLMIESLVLGLASGAVGLVIARAGVDVFRRIAPAGMPRIEDVGMGPAVVLFTIIVAVVTPFLFGLVPALRATRSDVRSVLGHAGRETGSSPGRGRLRAGLVATEIAMAALVVTGAALLLESLSNLRDVDPGFEADSLLTFQITVPPDAAPEAGPDMSVYRVLWDELAAIPGVTAAGGIHILPLGSSNNRYPYWAEGHTWTPGTPAPAVNIRVATPGYVAAMGIDIVAGRWFTDADRAGGLQVVVINRTLAGRLWPGESAVGKRIRLLDEGSEPWEIVGVIGDVKQMALARDALGELYLPHDQWRWPAMFAALRTTVPPESLVPAVRLAAARTNPAVTISRIRPMRSLLDDSVEANAFLARLTAVFAALALVLGVVGVYAVTSYAASRRIPEFGLRMALGSTPRRLVTHNLGRELRPVLIGLVLGCAAAWISARVLSSLLFGVQPFDLPTYLVVAVLIAGAAALAGYLPTLRATRVDPVTSIRLR